MKKAFTLIELLVVVLIIGILSAIALPQYTKAVEKSRLAEAFTNAKALQDSIDLYVLEKGLPTESIDLGDDVFTIGLSGGGMSDGSVCEDQCYVTPKYCYDATCTSVGCYVDVYRRNGTSFEYTLSYVRDTAGNWTKKCWTQDTDLGRSICKSLPDFTYKNSEY